MLRELGEFFDRYTEQRPLVLVTEDLHWSDHATIQLMDYIARRRGHARLMWIATFRLAEVIAYDHPLKAVRNELRLHGLCDEIVLDPFSEEEVAAYIAQRAPSLAATESDVRALHQRTDGLPLFVAQLVGDLAARKSLDRADVSAATLLERMAIPENLAAIIDHYVARLTLEQRSVLEAAAVCGVEFRVETLATVLEQDVASVAAICDALARALLWVSQSASDAANPGYRFRHALLQQGLYERIAPRVRTQLHRRVGAALERDRAAGIAVAPTELVMHFERGADPTAALRHCVHAAESLLHFNPGEVMRLTERDSPSSIVWNGTRNATRSSSASGLCAACPLCSCSGWVPRTQRLRFSARMNCSTTFRSTRRVNRCCSGWASCSVCARSMRKRSR